MLGEGVDHFSDVTNVDVVSQESLSLVDVEEALCLSKSRLTINSEFVDTRELSAGAG